jgi:glutathione S-transferase
MSRRKSGFSVSIQTVPNYSPYSKSTAKFAPGRIPVIIDNTKTPPFPVMETSAELLYLLNFADKDNIFGFVDELEKSECLQWLFFWHGSGAPYQGNLGFFNRAAEKIPCKSLHQPYIFFRSFQVYLTYLSRAVAIERFRKETYRVFGVLEIRLSGIYTGEPREYLVGKGKGKYSIADIGTWTWVKNWPRSGYTEEEMSAFPHLLQWIDRIAQRPAVKRGTGEKYTKL